MDDHLDPEKSIDFAPLIALTSHAMTSDRANAIDAGYDQFHGKPADFNLLLQQIDEVKLRREEAET